MKTLDYLPNTNIHLYQDSNMFRINSDTCNLGNFISLKKDDTILDIGTNNGALLLYAHKLGCKKLIGVDINSEAIKLCKENMILNNVSNYELYDCGVQNLNINKVDVIISNPPYFKNSLVNDNVDLKRARHDVSLSLDELISNSNRLLKNNGRIILVYKTTELIYLIKLLDEYKFGITKLQFINDESKEYSNTFLIEAVKNRKHDVKVLKSIIITH